ncbi:MAG: hypothetical protein JJU44_07660 [Planctomycetes bacterium]|nr:hypothetical protein [Planctomycetota bacterium]
MNGVVTIPLVLLGFLAAAVLLAILIFVFAKIFGLTWKILGNLFRFIGAEIGDTLRFVGAILSGLLFAPLVVLNIVIGRWSASKHFADAFWAEMNAAGNAVYRVFVGNPARLLGLGTALEGIEQRVPKAMAAAPGRDKPAKRVGQFDGYTIIGSLQGGGSGSKLYIAEPDAIKRAAFARQGVEGVDRVVIKVFSLKDGSSLPQIVRESRALDAAKKLGLVLEHDLTPDRFFYVMRYVPGDSLAVITQRLHAESPAEGLDNRRLATALGYGADLLASLDAYHRAGLWHKDVKPDNIIIDGHDHKAHLVDFGLVTPLRSAMTLTTHGTEYFRDPELVRQALRGVKVHEIDGSRFDLYAAGAVLYSVIENSFPAHGGLSQITKRCPEALRWIVRRAMTDYDRRYANASEMLADLRVVLQAADPFKLKPVDLPSVGGRTPEPMPEPDPFDDFSAIPPVPPVPSGPRRPDPVRATPVPPRPAAQRPKVRPAIRVRGGGADLHTPPLGPAARAAVTPGPPAPGPAGRPLTPADQRRSAADQVREARARARKRRFDAQNRIAARRGVKPAYTNSPGGGVVFAGFLGIAVFIALSVVVGSVMTSSQRPAPVAPISAPPAPGVAALPEAPLPTIDARILVVSELPVPVGEPRLTELRAGLTRIADQGATLIGDLLPDQDDGVIDTLALLRRDRGARPIDSDTMHQSVRDWLEGSDLDAVLMIAADPTDSDQTLSVLVTRNDVLKIRWSHAPGEIVRRLDAERSASPAADTDQRP